MSIKKSYIEIVEFLEANQGKKVSSIMAEVLSMAESKKQSTTFLLDKSGNVVAIYCYYHKQWEILADVVYGSKVNSSTGYNTMCKIGVSKWTKKQVTAKSDKSDLLDGISVGDIDPTNIKSLMADIETTRLTMDITNMPIGYVDEHSVWEALLNPKDVLEKQ